jgi:hypothetical protein
VEGMVVGPLGVLVFFFIASFFFIMKTTVSNRIYLFRRIKNSRTAFCHACRWRHILDFYFDVA